ncbi:MAG: 4-amino-4-deoxy-L-arabinose transferase [Firmicutes bacterium HGW-Firmicutes-1]|jgi:4-amino-4-deoxy-L-arabinose transferase-like glycosyltransferase|nr:MAG: 4-amino-4-deoxy-L-arabinose transferase [Firmicutes bacterium HGW-Firmicutes-1]
MKKKLQNMPFIIWFLFLYFIANIFFLTTFPFVHSDEAWLSGLTRNMMDTHSIYCTETFFDLFPRYPHSIKLLFHLVQMPFVHFGGNSVFSVRLISMFFSVATLYIFHKIMVVVLKHPLYALLSTILLSLNIQFLYASHFARQEIVVLFFLMLGLYVYLKPFKSTILLGSIIGLCIGIHPNSFILALLFGFLYLQDWIMRKKPFKEILLLVLTVSCFASAFILLSYIGDPNFIAHYSQFGATFGVDFPMGTKLLTLDDFYYKLYNSVSGTYYIPQMKYFWIAFLILLLISIGILISKKISPEIGLKYTLSQWLISLFAIQLGILIIGRYNTTSILFLIPFFYILLGNILIKIFKKNKTLLGLFVILIILSFILSIKEIKPYLPYQYNDYLNEFAKAVPKDSVVLGNLNTDFYFDNGSLFDYRNLAYLKTNDLSFKEYIQKNDIEYIIYYEELDYIHKNPRWLILYGDDVYYEDMNDYIKNNCTLIHSFKHTLYGIRIPRYMMDYEWEISIYKVLQ